MLTKGLFVAHVRIAARGPSYGSPVGSWSPTAESRLSGCQFCQGGGKRPRPPATCHDLATARHPVGRAGDFRNEAARLLSGGLPPCPTRWPRVSFSSAGTAATVDDGDPVRATLDVIEAQARFLDDAGLAPDTRRRIDYEAGTRRRRRCSRPGHAHSAGRYRPHPGNFMMQPDGTAMFVDIEKMLYGAPAIDLAHATVYTSTMWDADVAAALGEDEVAAFTQSISMPCPERLAIASDPGADPCAGLPGLGRRRGAPNGGWDRKTGRHGRRPTRSRIHRVRPEACGRLLRSGNHRAYRLAPMSGVR